VRYAYGLTLMILYGSAYCVTAIAWTAAVYYLFKTIANRQPGVRLWNAALGYFPLNLVFRPDLLTDRGRLCRRRFGISLLAFVSALGTGFALGGVARLLH
jgi:hypothetical protein